MTAKLETVGTTSVTLVPLHHSPFLIHPIPVSRTAFRIRLLDSSVFGTSPLAETGKFLIAIAGPAHALASIQPF
ncbi:hypothetical protein K432DRAFT_175905 [Lepidopterella palustris CBS 459.81]|uniref:Uncharacterized protein n=1 Tax=Lepidopterella palustris CBS 459.81 TaxID=1314670 RepID=A0A8E2JAF0_9PEZI|nr:hypothetical protein K432DRAFT_175905 [Lepidopterella palustris CBS 459.81]